MPSISGVRLGLCWLRCGPQPAGPVVFFCRQNHNVADTRCKNEPQLLPSRGMSAVAGQKQSKHITVDLSDFQKEINIAESFKRFRRFITHPGLVNSVLESLDPWEHHRSAPIIMECNPGPGVLTRALLEAGCKVVALESNSDFLPSLKKLEKTSGGQLKVVHCDFFRLDPWSEGVVQAPSMYSSDLMEQLGISEVPWDTEVPIKVFGMLRHKRERFLLWRNIYSLYERLSVFRYGRVELNMFMSDQVYKSLIVKPGNFRQYHALPALYTLAYDIQLLHKEHISSFLIPKKFKGPSVGKSGDLSDDQLCLVRLTPRKDLFSDRFTPADGKTFISMVKQCLVRRRSRLLDRLDSWNPGNGEQLLQRLHLPETIYTGNIYPEDYKLLYEILAHSEDFSQSFVLEDSYDDIACSAY
ncbi:dimethyladenosine transferase 2, mitochondrial [Gastrophryne carolinensis]